MIEIHTDCATCGAAGSVVRGYCQVCDTRAEDGRAADLPPAAPPGPLRLSDVLGELKAISSLVSGADGGSEVVDALHRTEMLLHGLHQQFLRDVIEGRPAASLSPADPKPQPNRPVT